MTFLRLHRIFVELAAFWALLALLFFSGISFIVVGAALAAYFLHLTRYYRPIRIPNWVWTILTLVALFGSVGGWVVLNERFYSVVFAFIYLQINKLWTYETNRDILQILGVSFFHFLAAAVSTASPLFAPAFALYLFLILGALILQTIKDDAERILTPKKNVEVAGDSRDELFRPRPVRLDSASALQHVYTMPVKQRGLYARLIVAQVFILTIGLMIFFILPRMQGMQGPGMIGGSGGTLLRTGFTDTVFFGGGGEIESDPSIIARAIPEGGVGRTREVLRLRGTSLDHFDGRRWTKSPFVQEEISPPTPFTRDIRVLPDPLFSDDSRAEIMRIQIEPNTKNFLFGPDRTVRFFGFQRDMTIRRDPISGSVQFQDLDWRQPLQYFVEVRNPAPGFSIHPTAEEAVNALTERLTGWRLGLAGLTGRGTESMSPQNANFRFRLNRELTSEEMTNLFLQMPDVPDMIVVRQLAQEWTDGLTNQGEIVRRIENRLMTEFGYSLDVSFSRRPDHITYFLTERRAGHCEYFATVMVLMLRSLDIPARIVNGYATDEWNGTGGGYFLVRQENAHSWVEVFYPLVGWVTYDPSPSLGIGTTEFLSNVYRRLSRWYDSMKFIWYNRIIDYGTTQQNQIWRSLFSGLRSVSSGLSEGFEGAGATSRRVTGVLVLGLGAGILIVSGLIFYQLSRRRSLKRSQQLRSTVRPEARIEPYLDLLNHFHELQPKTIGQTPLEYAKKIVAYHSQLEDFVPLTESYYSARFNGSNWSEKETQRAKALLRLTEQLKQAPPQEPKR